MTKSTYVVSGPNWEKEIEIDDSIFDMYVDMCVEAATRVLESIDSFKREDVLSDFIIVNAKDTNNYTIVSTSNALTNAGFHEAAKIFDY